MTKEQIFKELDEVFQDVFDDEDIHVNENTTADDIEEWDSLTNIQLVVAIEKAFGIKFKSSEIMSWSNVGEMINSICDK